MTMHLPWKKSKIGRVSRFVSDLRSTKHGGSLVVETGFPTSLIDLIVKNRDRLKKSSSTKNKKKRTNNNSLEISDNSIPPPPSSSSSHILSSSDSLNSTTLAIVSSPRIKNHPENEKKIPHLVQKVDVEEEEEVAEEVISAPNRTFTLIMKLFFLLILAIGTKKLAVAITVLAFFLLFLEFSCSRFFFCFLKPCPNAKKRFNSVVESVVNSVHHHQKDCDDELIIEESGDQTTTISENSCCRSDMFESGEDNTVSSSSNNSSMAKKEEQGGGGGGGSSSNNEEIQMIEPGFDSLHCGCRWGFTEKSSKRIKNEDLIHENSDIRNDSRSRNNGSAKFKSKLLKKFVPKKFLHSKKKRNNNGCEDINNNNEDEEEEQQRNHNLEEGGDSTSDLSNSNSQEEEAEAEAEDDEKLYRGGEEEQKQKQQDNQVEKHKNDSDDEHKKSGYVSLIEMQTDNHPNN